MKDADIQRMLDEAWTAWDSPMAQAEAGTIVPAADDVGFIAKRLKELDAERAEETENTQAEAQTAPTPKDEVGS